MPGGSFPDQWEAHGNFMLIPGCSAESRRADSLLTTSGTIHQTRTSTPLKSAVVVLSASRRTCVSAADAGGRDPIRPLLFSPEWRCAYLHSADQINAAAPQAACNRIIQAAIDALL